MSSIEQKIDYNMKKSSYLTPDDVKSITDFDSVIKIDDDKWIEDDFILLKNFKKIDIRYNMFVNDQILMNFENVEELNISGCNGCIDLDGAKICEDCYQQIDEHCFKNFKKNSSKITKLDGITGSSFIHLKNLKKLTAEFCEDLATLELAHPEKLESLVIHNVDEKLFSFLPKFKNLRTLSIDCEIDDDTLMSLTNLEQLNINSCFDNGTIPLITGTCFSRLTKLRKLKIGYNNIVDDVSLSHLRSLESLNIVGCKNINGSCFKFMKNLKDLTISSCEANKTITDDSLKELIKLEKLKIPFNGLTITGSCFKFMTNLKTLDVSLKTITNDSIKDLVNLEELHIHNNSITDEAFQLLVNLKILNLSCRKITINAFKNLNNLEELSISGTNEINDISPLSELKKLKKIYFHLEHHIRGIKKLLNNKIEVKIN